MRRRCAATRPTSRTCAFRSSSSTSPIWCSDCEFKVFAGPAANPNGRVAALRVPQGGTKLSRKEIDDYTTFVGRYGAKGLAYVKVNEKAKGRDGLQSPILKFLSDDAISGILSRTGAEDGDLIFFGADTAKVVNDSTRRAAHQGRPRSRARADRLAAAVGRRLPDVRMGRGREALGRLHHPFTAPRSDDAAAPACRSGQRDLQGLRHGAERLGDRRRLGAYPSPGNAVDRVRSARHQSRKKRRRSSASCSKRSSSARRRTAASRSASIAS